MMNEKKGTLCNVNKCYKLAKGGFRENKSPSLSVIYTK